ncbi:ABC transporter ATP-binding protein [Nannocystis pusilla]|uniref:ABC transporter ATP-binding protein/permease n=1 Tax=Nannocystis pusilla TaxID=889268 RepID=A0ABS7U5A3_9BACT|nr:ABC transporter ATP-binding protein [Nannocystis pusilla]MBZ5715740.1 ABC transporter ATP-binding protein/permease [Nannocystis pusilla]
MTLIDLTWSLERAGEALTALAVQAGLQPALRELGAPGAAVLADPDDAAIERWLAGAAAGLGLEAEAVDTDVAGVDALLRTAAPALLRVGPDGRALLLLLRGGRRTLLVLAPDLRPRRVALDDVRRAVCEHVLAPLRGRAEVLVDRTGLRGQRRERAVELLLRERLGVLRVGRAFILRTSPAAPLLRLLRAEGLLARAAALALLYAAELALMIAAWWLIGGLVFAGRTDAGWSQAWLLLLLTVVPCRMGQAAIAGEILRAAGALLKRRLLVGALALPGDLTRREGAGLLLGRVLETSAVESLGLRGGLVSLVAVLEFAAAVPILALGPAPALHLVLLAAWAALGVALVARTGLHLTAWTDTRGELTHHLVEAMVGHRTRLAQEARERWHDDDDARLVRVLARERDLNRSESLLVALLPRGWLVLGLAALLPAFVAGSAPAATIAAAIGGVLLAQRGLATFVAGAIALLGCGVAVRQALPMLRAAEAADAGAHGLMLSFPPVPEGQPIVLARGLGFRYPGRERQVLRDVDLAIAAGDRLLLEGGSGGGKSTLGALVAGLREPTAGLVLLAGLDRPTLGLVGWRRRVAAAPQFHENHIVTAPLAFNLLMGRGWPPTQQQLAEADAVCRELGLGELLERMPSGLQQMVGETGWQLSHGERSRLFIARALLQSVDLVVLDESFAALDPATLQQALRCVLERARAVLVIAHP